MPPLTQGQRQTSIAGGGILGEYQLFFGSLCGGQPTVPFFTLNYDTAVEVALAQLKIRCVDGILPATDHFERRWNSVAFTNYEVPHGTGTSVVLVKLHGSVRLAERNTRDGSILVELTEGLPRNPGQLRNALLYPSLNPKDLTRDPFRTCYRIFDAVINRDTTRCLIIIGFSFRDQEVNLLLRNALEDNFNLHLVVIDPALDHAAVAQQIGCETSRIRVIQTRFGPETAEDLRNGKGAVLLSDLRYWVGAAIGEQLPPGDGFGGTAFRLSENS